MTAIKRNSLVIAIRLATYQINQGRMERETLTARADISSFDRFANEHVSSERRGDGSPTDRAYRQSVGQLVDM